jgi:hypothetical protein
VLRVATGFATGCDAEFAASVGAGLFEGCGFGFARKKFSEVTNRCELGAAGGWGRAAGAGAVLAVELAAGRCGGAGCT